jgi:hypothetical protein
MDLVLDLRQQARTNKIGLPQIEFAMDWPLPE